VTNEQIGAELERLNRLLVPAAEYLMDLACQGDHSIICECKTCRAFGAVHECQSCLEVLARVLVPVELAVTCQPPGYDCLVGELPLTP
jgi:predicted deacylase